MKDTAIFSDADILRALIEQVSKAVPNGGNETDVITLVSRPMWRAWCRGAGIPEGSQPTEWIGSYTFRIYGSRTIIVESELMAAASFADTTFLTLGWHAFFNSL